MFKVIQFYYWDKLFYNDPVPGDSFPHPFLSGRGM